MRSGELLGYSDRKKIKNLNDHVIVVTPLLHLTQRTALVVATRHSYVSAFKDAVVVLKEGELGKFSLIHSTFDLYNSGSSTLSNFAVLVHGASVLPPLKIIISAATKLLERE